jgi:hypothetical protein
MTLSVATTQAKRFRAVSALFLSGYPPAWTTERGRLRRDSFGGQCKSSRVPTAERGCVLRVVAGKSHQKGTGLCCGGASFMWITPRSLGQIRNRPSKAGRELAGTVMRFQLIRRFRKGTDILGIVDSRSLRFHALPPLFSGGLCHRPRLDASNPRPNQPTGSPPTHNSSQIPALAGEQRGPRGCASVGDGRTQRPNKGGPWGILGPAIRGGTPRQAQSPSLRTRLSSTQQTALRSPSRLNARHV